MSYKKFAMLILTMTAIFAIGAKTTVSASAKEDVAKTTVASVATASAVTASNNVSASKSTKKVITKKVKVKKVAKKNAAYSKADLRLMASIINCEAGAEPYQGKIAVGVVIMNRIKSKSFPSTLKKVIYQKYQFSPVRNGSLKKRLSQYDRGKTGSKQWKDCISAAKKTLEGQNTIIYKGSVKSMKGYYFFSVYLSKPKFKLGGHKFK